MPDFNEWHRFRFPDSPEADSPPDTKKTVFGYLAAAFLYGKDLPKLPTVQNNLEKAEMMVHRAFERGLLTLLLDALDVKIRQCSLGCFE